MGGVWFPREGEPTLWRADFPEEIKRRLITHENPTGNITNSDLELAATIVHLDMAAHNFPVHLQTLAVLSDNAATVFWQRKGSTTTTKATAYLLRLQGMHQRWFRYNSVFNHIAGQANIMADTASRSSALTDSQLLHVFSHTFPQTHSWHLSTPRNEILSAVNCALSCARPQPESFLPQQGASEPCGTSGKSSYTTWDQSTHTTRPAILSYATHFPTAKGSKPSSSLSPVYAPENSQPAVSPSELVRWMRPFEQFRRPSCWQDTTTPESNLAVTIPTTSLAASSEPGAATTHHPTVSDHSPYNCFRMSLTVPPPTSSPTLHNSENAAGISSS
jgi:hypothetical protein